MKYSPHRLTSSIDNSIYTDLETWCHATLKPHSYKLTPFSKHPQFLTNLRHYMFETTDKHSLALFKLTWLN